MGDHVATIDMDGEEGGAAVPTVGGGATSPCNILSSGPGSTSVQSRIFIHPAVSLQRAWTVNGMAVPRWG